MELKMRRVQHGYFGFVNYWCNDVPIISLLTESEYQFAQKKEKKQAIAPSQIIIF